MNDVNNWQVTNKISFHLYIHFYYYKFIYCFYFNKKKCLSIYFYFATIRFIDY